MYYAIINQDVIIYNFFSKSAHLQIDMESSMTGCHLYHFNGKNLFCHHEPVKRAGGQGTGFKHDFSVNKLIQLDRSPSFPESVFSPATGG